MKKRLVIVLGLLIIVLSNSALFGYTSYGLTTGYAGRATLAPVGLIHQAEVSESLTDNQNLFGIQIGYTPKSHYGGWDGELCGMVLFGQDNFLMNSTLSVDLLLGYGLPLGKKWIAEADGVITYGSRMTDIGVNDRFQQYSHMSGGGAFRLFYLLNDDGHALFLKIQHTRMLSQDNPNEIKVSENNVDSIELAFKEINETFIYFGYSLYF